MTRGSYAQGVDGTIQPTGTRAERRDRATAETRTSILGAARQCLLADGYANLSTRRVADSAGVPLSQIHYHYGSKHQLVLAVLAEENERLLGRQRAMFDAPEPLWARWDRACDFLDTDVASGYVRILQEMIAAASSARIDSSTASAVQAIARGIAFTSFPGSAAPPRSGAGSAPPSGARSASAACPR